MKNTSKLVGDYAGLEATKTGYLCASGFNVVASAIRGGKRVVGVVFGSPSAATRTLIARELLDAGISGATGRIGNLRTIKADVPTPGTDLRRFKCGRQAPLAAGTILAGGNGKPAGTLQLRR